MAGGALKPYFTGQEEPRKVMTTCQNVFTGDIENVGKLLVTVHSLKCSETFLFGDYFKEDAIAWLGNT